MEIYKACDAYRDTKERFEEIKKIKDFLLTEECGLVAIQIKNSVQVGSFTAVLDKKHFCWNYDMIYKSFTHLGYEVRKNEWDDIVLDWTNGWKNYYGKTTKRMK